MRAVTSHAPEFGCLGDLKITVAETEIRSASDRKVAQIARLVLPGVGVFLFLTGVLDTLPTSESVPGAFSAAPWVAGAMVLALWGTFTHGLIPDRFANATVSAAAALVLIQAALQAWGGPLALPSVHFCVVIVGTSSILLSWRWFAATVTAAVGCWVAAVFLLAGSGDATTAETFRWMLAPATLIGFVIHHQRIRAYHNRFSDAIIDSKHKETLKQAQSRYESAVRGSNDGLWYWDLEAKRVYGSARWAQMVGYPEGAVSLSPNAWWDAVDPYYLEGLRSAINAHLERRSAQLEYKHRIRKQDGSHIWVLTRGLAVHSESGKPKSIAGSMTDISHVIEIEQRLVHDALQDKLTGLANRNCLMTELQIATEESRESGKLIALIFLDLDGFKFVNDSLGHPIGDQLLSEVAKRLWTCTRPGDTLARYGGDEFILLLNEIGEPQEAEHIARQMQQLLSAPFEVLGHSLRLTASVGISVNSPGAWKHDELLRNADIAMYRAKAEGAGQIRVFNSEMHGQARRSWELQNAVRGVVDRKECLLRYQPIVSLEDGSISGAEALFRWRAPGGEHRSTAELILAAERTGSIVGIGEWVLRKTCADAADWQRRGLPPIRVSANVSAHQLRLPGFAALVASIVKETDLDPHWLELELTETAFMQDIDTVCANLHSLVELGVALAVDDFGTGYSSLSYLARFPLNTLKIDGSLISGIAGDPQTAALTKGVISLAHSLGLRVTAEMVETNEQLEFLTDEGCDRVQGYLLSEPLTADRMARVLENDERLLPATSLRPIPFRRSLAFASLRQAVGM